MKVRATFCNHDQDTSFYLERFDTREEAIAWAKTVNPEIFKQAYGGSPETSEQWGTGYFWLTLERIPA